LLRLGLRKLAEPTVTIGKEPDEEGTTPVDLVETCVQDSGPFRLFFKNTPAEIDIDEQQFARGAAFAEFRKNETDKQIALNIKIT